MKNKIIVQLREALENAKSSIAVIEKLLQNLTGEKNFFPEKIEKAKMKIDGDEKIIEGIFDGQNMIAGKKIFPVPVNYASKSKLVEGDKLKLTIRENGEFIYKQIELVPREFLVGHLILEESQYKILASGREFCVLRASVTFFRAEIGDEITIAVPKKKSAKWAAIENILPKIQK